MYLCTIEGGWKFIDKGFVSGRPLGMFTFNFLISYLKMTFLELVLHTVHYKDIKIHL